MFVRRNKELAQTVCILVLLATLGYSIYLYNSLQLKLQNTEIRSKKFESQHQSLSNQLQKIYADHARAQGLYELEKQEHSKTKNDLEAAQRDHNEELEKLHSLHFEEKNQLKEENSELRMSKNEMERNLDETMNMVQQLKSDKGLLENSHEEDLRRLQSQEHENQESSEILDQLQKEHSELKKSHEKSQNYNQFLSSRIDLLKNETNSYDKLKSILQSIGADALNLEHARLLSLTSTDRSLLYRHFGSDEDHVKMLQSNRLKAEQLEQERKQALETQRLAKEERDRQLKLRASQSSNNQNINSPKLDDDGVKAEDDNTDAIAAYNDANDDQGADGEQQQVKPAGVSDQEWNNQMQEQKAKEELESQNLMMQGVNDANPDEVDENNDKLSQENREHVIDEIKKLQSVQQQIAQDQQADLLELQRRKEEEDTKDVTNVQEPEQAQGGKYVDEDESKVQLNEPPVAGEGDVAIGQGYIGAPDVADDNDLKSNEKAEIEEPYNYGEDEEEEEEEEEEDENGVDNGEYDEGNNEQVDENDLAGRKTADDESLDKVWSPQEAGQAARAERRNMAAMEENDRDF